VVGVEDGRDAVEEDRRAAGLLDGLGDGGAETRRASRHEDGSEPRVSHGFCAYPPGEAHKRALACVPG
jgi:hypothetical protein